MVKEERKEYMKKYREKNKDKIRELKKKWYVKNNKQVKEYHKQWYEKNNKQVKEYRNQWYKNKHDQALLCNWVNKYYKNFYFRHISLENYITIMKLEDLYLKKSIMVKLGKGLILEDEAVALSGMVFTEDDLKQLDNYLKNRKSRKRSSSKS